jgi:hypothetical protein
MPEPILFVFIAQGAQSRAFTLVILSSFTAGFEDNFAGSFVGNFAGR